MPVKPLITTEATLGALATALPLLKASFPYRVRQFLAALEATLSVEERALVESSLTPAEMQLFATMPTYDQRHCLDVHRTLVDAGHTDPLLLRAALFHDCGKVDDAGRPMALHWYVAATMLKRVPGLYLAAARILPPIAVYANHARRGARMASAAGSPLEIVSAICHYHDPHPSGMAALLQWADEQN